MFWPCKDEQDTVSSPKEVCGLISMSNGMNFKFSNMRYIASTLPEDGWGKVPNMWWYMSWVLKDKSLLAADLLEGVQLLQRNNGRKRHGYLEDQLVLLVWLKCRARRGRGGWSEKGGGRKGGRHGRPKPAWDLCVLCHGVWTGSVDSREPSRIYKQGNDMLRRAF